MKAGEGEGRGFSRYNATTSVPLNVKRVNIGQDLADTMQQSQSGKHVNIGQDPRGAGQGHGVSSQPSEKRNWGHFGA